MIDSFGSRVKLVRNLLGLNQTEYGIKLRIEGQGVISRYEKDQRMPDVDTIRKIATLGNVETDWLIYGTGFTYCPSNTQQAVNWILEKLEITRRITIITYDVGGFSPAHGFALVTSHGFITMEGRATTSGFMGGGPKGYKTILERLLKEENIAKEEVYFKRNPDWKSIDIEDYVRLHGRPVAIGKRELQDMIKNVFSKMEQPK